MDNEWHHLALAFNGVLATLYFDGQSCASRNLPINTPGDDFLVGRTHNGYSPYDGAIDDLRIYGRSLSVAEINALYSEPAPAKLAEPVHDADADTFNYGLGTQTFQPQYQFTAESKLLETAEAIEQMGSGVIKFFVGNNYPGQYNITLPPSATNLSSLAQNEASCRAVFDMPFQHYILWTYCLSSAGRVPGLWTDGFSAADKQAEYAEMYDFARYLLTNYNNSGKSFYLGHWEGDWYLLPDSNTLTNPSPTAIQGMRDWLNTRQQAVDDAKRDTPHSGVDVFVYTEVNRVRDAMSGWQRVVNQVVPYVTNLDYVSYSSYDMEDLSPVEIIATLNYAESQMPTNKAREISGKRLFIGEYGWGGQLPDIQESRSRSYAQTLLGWGCPFVLWWEMYNNEAGMNWCLINSNGEKTANYYFHQRFLNAAKLWVAEFKQAIGRIPTAIEYQQWAVTQLNAPLEAPITLNVSTLSASSAGVDAAVVNGSLRQGVYGDHWGRVFVAWGTNDGGTSVGKWGRITEVGINSGFGPAAFSATLAALDPQQTYYYRFFANPFFDIYDTNTSGIAWSDASASFMLSSLQRPAFDFQQGLIAYYPFNISLKDESGHSLDGSPLGQCDFTTNRFGISKTALTLSTKVPGAVRVSSNLLPRGNAARTISVWVKPDFNNLSVIGPTEKSGVVFSFGASLGHQDELWLDVKLLNGTNFVTSVVVQSPVQFLHTSQPVDDGWHQLVVVFDGVFVTYYIDGVVRVFAQLPINNQTSELLIGRMNVGARQYAGAIDDLRIYNRALSPDEVGALYIEPERPEFESIGLFPGFVIRGIVGQSYTIQYATSVSPSIWITLTNVSLTVDHEMWIDTNADVRSQPRRFYRIIQP